MTGTRGSAVMIGSILRIVGHSPTMPPYFPSIVAVLRLRPRIACGNVDPFVRRPTFRLYSNRKYQVREHFVESSRRGSRYAGGWSRSQ